MKEWFSKLDAKFGKWIVKTFAKRIIRHRLKYGGKIDEVRKLTTVDAYGKVYWLESRLWISKYAVGEFAKYEELPHVQDERKGN